MSGVRDPEQIQVFHAKNFSREKSLIKWGSIIEKINDK